MKRAQRVVHFGIDGGSFRILDALARRGLLPEYSSLRRRAGTAILRSTTPWFSVPGWTTWMTGVSAERHGLIYWTATRAGDYWDRQGAGRRFPSANDIPHPTLFRLLSDAGRRVGSLNMPVTYPPEPVNGVMVSGFLGPQDRDRVAHPKGFLHRYPDYVVNPWQGEAKALGIDAERPDALVDVHVEKYARALASAAEARHRVMVDLLADSFDMVSVVHVGPDRLSHVAWPQIRALCRGGGRDPVGRAVGEYYSTLDRMLGEAARAAEDGVFLVTSDHGQGPPPERLVAPNAWLKSQGWLALRGKGVRRASRFVTWPALRRRVWRTWRRVHNIPSGSSPFVAWDETVAFAIPMGQVFGVAVRGDRGLQQQVAASFLELEDPETGERPVERVVVSSDVCEGPGLDSYPELMVTLRSGYGSTEKIDGSVVRRHDAGRNAYHEPEGLLMALGERIPAGGHPEAGIADVAPTILSALGVPAPGWMDGRAIEWIANGRYDPTAVIPERDPAAGAELSTEEEEAIARHLAGLGYIE